MTGRPLACFIVLTLGCASLPWTGGAAEEGSSGPSKDLESLNLMFPVPAVSPTAMRDTFKDRRGRRRHRAVDIMAPRHSEVVAVADGTIAQLTSKGAGGIAVYQYSEDRRFCFFYAHLHGYAPGLVKGQSVRRGEVIGFVGSTGNAPERAPHLHFAIAADPNPEQWWSGKPVNPYPAWRSPPPVSGIRSPR